MERLLVDGRDVTPIEVAGTARARGRGLLGRSGIDGAMWLSPCRHVHTMRMKFSIDIAHLDRARRVIAVETVRANRFARFHWRTRSILEAEAGAFETWGLKAGSVIDVRAGAH